MADLENSGPPTGAGTNLVLLALAALPLCALPISAVALVWSSTQNWPHTPKMSQIMWLIVAVWPALSLIFLAISPTTGKKEGAEYYGASVGLQVTCLIAVFMHIADLHFADLGAMTRSAMTLAAVFAAATFLIYLCRARETNGDMHVAIGVLAMVFGLGYGWALVVIADTALDRTARPEPARVVAAHTANNRRYSLTYYLKVHSASAPAETFEVNGLEFAIAATPGVKVSVVQHEGRLGAPWRSLAVEPANN